LFDLQKGGALIFDHVDELNDHQQAVLSKALRDKRFVPIGSEHPIRLDIRLIFLASNELEELVESGRFRRDLFDQLRMFQHRIPGLDDRLEDIPALVDSIINRVRKESRTTVVSYDPRINDFFRERASDYTVADMEVTLKRAMVLAETTELTYEQVNASQEPGGGGLDTQTWFQKPWKDAKTDVKIHYLRYLARVTGRVMEKMAKRAGVPRETIYRWNRECDNPLDLKRKPLIEQ
jgi:DNA-binding NtrC family response regulator